MKSNECIVFAMEVRQAVGQNNYVKFFRLFEVCLTDYYYQLFVPECTSNVCIYYGSFCRKGTKTRAKGDFPRVGCLHRFWFKFLLFSYRPTIPVSIVAKLLALKEDELIDWLTELKLDVGDDGNLDCRVLSSKTL